MATEMLLYSVVKLFFSVVVLLFYWTKFPSPPPFLKVSGILCSNADVSQGFGIKAFQTLLGTVHVLLPVIKFWLNVFLVKVIVKKLENVEMLKYNVEF